MSMATPTNCKLNYRQIIICLSANGEGDGEGKNMKSEKVEKWKSGKLCVQSARQLNKLSNNATDGNAKSCHKS